MTDRTEGRTDGSTENWVGTAEFLSQVALFKSLESKVLGGLGSRMRMVHVLRGDISKTTTRWTGCTS